MLNQKSYAAILLLMLTLSACGGGGGGDGNDPGIQSADESLDVQIAGKPAVKDKRNADAVPAPAPDSFSSTTLSHQQLLDDMTKPHESHVHGVNPDWGWGSNPRIGVDVNFPSSFDDPSFTPWGVAATSTSGSPARNARVQLRKMILDVKRNGTWSRIVYNTDASQLMGSLYTNYETNTHVAANVRNHGTDGISVRMPDSGGSFHFMTTNRFRVAHGAQEIVSRVEARLIVDDASKADDRSSAKLLVTSGGDIWRNQTASWDPSTTSNVDFAIGRFKYVTNEWKSFTSHTLSSTDQYNDYLANEPVLSPR